jgi:hypothetical protein
MRCNCFPELHDLFKHAHNPAKEFTESYAALAHTTKTRQKYLAIDCIHVGDGAHARTGALFAFLTKNTYNYSIDPATNEQLLENWVARYNVERLVYYKDKVEDLHFDLLVPKLVTFVHAHVNTDEVLSRISNWVIAYTNPCCYPEQQLSKKFKCIDHGYDWSILSDKREYQVLINEEA